MTLLASRYLNKITEVTDSMSKLTQVPYSHTRNSTNQPLEKAYTSGHTIAVSQQHLLSYIAPNPNGPRILSELGQRKEETQSQR
jgi:hypothetical protein